MIRTRRHSKEEFARRGDEWYEQKIRAQVEPGRAGEIVAIDIESGDWEVDPGETAACLRLETRRFDAQIWIIRVGCRSVRRFGALRRCRRNGRRLPCRRHPHRTRADRIPESHA